VVEAVSGEQATVPQFTGSHAFALRTSRNGGHALAKHLRAANLLTSAIGLPNDVGAEMSGLRIGTNEIVRSGMATSDMAELAGLLDRAIGSDSPADLASDVAAFRSRFTDLQFVN
jgi:glycine/serine hydroxymethyltransferase